MSVNSAVFSNLQSINPSAVIELFTLQLSTALHGANTIYRFHAGSNLNANGKIVWAGNEYLRFPIQATGFAFQKGQLPRPKISISNATGLISSILLDVNQTTTGNDLTGATVTRIRTLAKFLDAVNFEDGTNATADNTAEFPQEIYVVDRKNENQQTIADFTMSVDLPKEAKGTHMSRFIEILKCFHQEINHKNLLTMIKETQIIINTFSCHHYCSSDRRIIMS